eukprot:1153955-Pelagomonas_calceolata.AAC.1
MLADHVAAGALLLPAARAAAPAVAASVEPLCAAAAPCVRQEREQADTSSVIHWLWVTQG